MALSAGSVTANADGTRTGSGLALALYDARKTPIDANLAANGSPTLPATFWPGIAAQANADAAAIIPYFTANGTAKVATTANNIQRTPNPNNPDTACQGPTADRFLPIV